MAPGETVPSVVGEPSSSTTRGPAPRETRLLSLLAPWIPRNASLLDVGAGRGLVARALTDALGVQATLVDVLDYNQTSLPLQLFDGRRLPFADRSFDVALVAFVLHHAPDPVLLLKEVKRVGRRVVILEDTYRSAVEHVSAWWTDWILNREHGVQTAWGRRTPEGWLDMLGREVTIVHSEELPPKWLGSYRDPIRHLLVVGSSP